MLTVLSPSRPRFRNIKTCTCKLFYIPSPTFFETLNSKIPEHKPLSEVQAPDLKHKMLLESEFPELVDFYPNPTFRESYRFQPLTTKPEP